MAQQRSNYDRLRDASLITDALKKEEHREALYALDPEIVDELIKAAGTTTGDDGGVGVT